jgi:glycosyltransferase involved in cell wall biosynthesis
MLIGIDASRAFVKQRTGIEEYSYQTIKNLANKLKNHQIVLYLKQNQKVDFTLPQNWKTKIINFPCCWTQIGLSLELLLHPADVLFIPSHIVPIIHPKNTAVTVHGLEYEILPEAYSFLERLYMRWSIKKSCQWASSIIAVSNNTKLDLKRLYGIEDKKIHVVYEGCNPISGDKILNSEINAKYLLFIGRLEERKNIIGIIRTFEILKEHYKIPHKLILAGKFGYGEEKIKKEIADANHAKDIILTGFISEEKKWNLLRNAEIFLFPTFYEGFGLPVLEAQSVDVPVIASDNSSIPEISGNNSAVLIDPKNAEQIADAAYKLISDKDFRNGIIKKGYENVKRFSWEKCADKISEILTK